MKIRNLQVITLAIILSVIGLSIFLYKVNYLHLPIRPDTTSQIWTIEARINFSGGKKPIKINFAVPNKPQGFTILDEDFVSGNYGLSFGRNDENRIAKWAVRRAKGEQFLYYRIRISPDSSVLQSVEEKQPSYPASPPYPELEKTAILSLLDQVRSKSADTITFTQELLSLLNTKQPSENVKLIQKNRKNSLEWALYVQNILAGAHIPSRLVHVLKLKDGMRSGELLPWIEVFNSEVWTLFDPLTSTQGASEDTLIWYKGANSLLEVNHADNPTTRFSVMRDTVSQLTVAERKASFLDSKLIEYSLLGLPLQTQNVYKILIVVPLGAFILVFLRCFIGIKTFGTFMPILIALAFYETQLLWGIILFSLLTALGLSVRFYFEQLKLLLVPRLASVLIVVILLMIIISILSHKLGLERGLSVALFPMVILTMVIERMSLAWEESGAREALIMGAGSLVAAVLSYLVMQQPLIKHIIFVFPELLLVILALTLLMGRYTGYRLFELWRFRSLIKEKSTS